MILQLPIYHHTDTTATFKAIDVDYKLEDCDVRPITFYHVNAVSVYLEDGVPHASIHSNNSEYISPLSYQIVNEYVQKAKQAPEKPYDLYTGYKKGPPKPSNKN